MFAQRLFGGFGVGRLRPIFLKTEGQGRLVDITQTLTKKRFVRRLTLGQTRLCDHVAIRHWRGQARLLTKQMSTYFIQQNHNGRRVVHQIMKAQPRDPALLLRLLAIVQGH